MFTADPDSVVVALEIVVVAPDAVKVLENVAGIANAAVPAVVALKPAKNVGVDANPTEPPNE